MLCSTVYIDNSLGPLARDSPCIYIYIYLFIYICVATQLFLQQANIINGWTKIAEIFLIVYWERTDQRGMKAQDNSEKYIIKDV